MNSVDIKLLLLLNSWIDLFQLKEKIMQTSKSVLGFQAQLYTEISRDEYIIMVYISIVIYVTLANLTEQANVS